MMGDDVMIIMVIIVLVLIVLAIHQTKKNSSGKLKEEGFDSNPYTVILRIRPELLNEYSPSVVVCRDKKLFLPADRQHSETLIGSYRQDEKSGWTVFDAESNLIGGISNESDNIMFFSTARKTCDALAERIQSCAQPIIIDRDTYDWLASYEGDSVEAAAAFLCWAFVSRGNKYSDFFH